MGNLSLAGLFRACPVTTGYVIGLGEFDGEWMVMDDFGTCRVVIDLRRIQENLKVEGAMLRERDVMNWLQCVGFFPEPDGSAWRANEECLYCLDETEFSRVS